MPENDTGTPKAGGVERPSVPVPPSSGQAAPRLWPIAVILGIQGVYLIGLHVLASRYPVTAEIVPFDTLALPESDVEIRVALCSRGHPSTPESLEGIVVLLRPEEPEQFLEWSPGGSESGSTTPVRSSVTNPSGEASWSVRAPKTPGIHVLEAWVDSASFGSPPVKVLLEVAPAEAAVVLIQVPGAIERDLELPQSMSLKGSAAAQALREIARFGSLAYVLDPRWSRAESIHDRLDARGFPRAPVLRTQSPSGSSLSGEILRLLELARRRAPLWGVLGDRDAIAEFVASGFRVVVVGANDSPLAVSGSVVTAPTWADVRKTIVE